MLFKIIIILFFVAMVVSLFSGLYYLVKEDNSGRGTLRSLTLRISIWVVLLILLGVGMVTGLIEPSNSLKPLSP